jgi:hypothetical protein
MKSIHSRVLSLIDKIEEGKVFSPSDLNISNKDRALVYQSLSRLTKDGRISRISHGNYYIPKRSRFGILKPNDDEVIKTVVNKIYRNTKTKPFLASNNVYQKLGLTTQVSNEIFLVCNIKSQYSMKIKNLKFNLIKHEGRWSSNLTKYFEFLYALQTIQKIPDTTVDESYKKLRNIMSHYTVKEVSNLVESSQEFKKRTQALLGIMLEMEGYKAASEIMKKKLNKNTSYEINITNTTIPTEYKKRWKIHEST